MAGAQGDPHRAAKPPLLPARWRRLVSLLRQRDWLGIAIELAVVTLGVLLAFQIDQWGQDRRQARDERQFLERMWRETADAVHENERVMRLHARFRREFIDGMSDRNDPAAMARLAATPDVGCRATSLPPLGFNQTGYQELSASGRLNIISDAALRADLRDVVAAQADAAGQLENARPLSLENQRALDPYYVQDLDRDGNRTCRMDWPRLVRDQHARNAIVRSARLHTLMWLKRAYARDTLLKAHNRIACILRKPDCRQRVEQILRARPMVDIIPPEAIDAVERFADMYEGS
jgi:hypothetical protein